MNAPNAPRNAKSAQREHAAVEAAAELFPKAGIEPVKMTVVAEAAGIGVASLYRYFDTKVNLALAAGTLLWRRFNDSIEATLGEGFDRKTGFAQLEDLFGLFTRMYRTHPEFLSFLDELDHMLLSTSPDAGLLAAYDAEVTESFPLFQASYERGVADGTVRAGIDFPLYYRTMSHALMSAGQKLIRGEVVPSDDFSEGWLELQMAVDVTLAYLKPRAFG